MISRKRLLFFGLLVVCFVLGSYFWKINNTGAYFWRSEEHSESTADLDFTVFVGDYLVARDEVEWEYQMYISQLTAPEVGSQNEAKPIEGEVVKKPDRNSGKINLELYNKILADLIERKLLYQYLTSDEKFSLRDVSRYTSCMQEFVETGNRRPDLVMVDKHREHLKSMLCEKSILNQYIRERVNTSGVEPSEEQIRSLYTSNKSKWREPERVIVRQIVLGSEDDAKKLRALVTTENFAAMALEHSISPEAKNGGVLGPFAKGELPSVFDVAFEMKPRTIQGILKSTYGFHILMLERKLPRVDLSYEAAKPKIAKELAEKRQNEEYTKWVESALNTIPIKSSRTF